MKIQSLHYIMHTYEADYTELNAVILYHVISGHIDISQVIIWERSGSVVECLTRDRRAAGSSHTVVTVLCP